MLNNYAFLGYKSFLEALEHDAYTAESCIELMNKNEILLIYPGGTREVIYSDHNYKLFWQNRYGFARVAIQTKAVCVCF